MARRRRKDDRLIDIALEAPWQFSAVLAVAIFFGVFVWLPHTGAFGPYGPSIFFGVRFYALLLLLFVFSAISLYKFLRQQAARPRGYTYDFGPRPQPGQHDLRRMTGADQRVEPTHDTEPAAGLKGAASGSAIRSPVARPAEWSLTVLRGMEWKRFEDLCLAFYRAKGIRAESTPLGPDGGVDVRLYQDDADPQRCTAVVQCKALNRAIGVSLVRELRGVMAHERVDKGFFMASSRYTEEARAFATANRITLLDGRQLLAMLQRLPAEVSRNLLAAATAGDWTTPSCPACGTKMVARRSARGAYWGCAVFPKCKQTLGMRERNT